jgi:hypothetical protein
MRMLAATKLIRAERVKPWMPCRRHEAAITAVKRAIQEKV